MAEANVDLVDGRAGMPLVPSVLGDVANAAEWLHRRRWILSLLEEEMYGRLPPRPARLAFVVDWEKSVFGGLGLCRQVTLQMGTSGRMTEAKALWFLPAGSGCFPVVCALNFSGNAGTCEDADVYRTGDEAGEPRGWQQGRWAFRYLLEQGISCLTAARNDFFPDRPDGRAASVFRLFHNADELTVEHRGHTAISAWAWGYSRLVDLAMAEPRVDARRIWIHGHSRLGKTALWAGAHDPRIAGVVSNDSGCCGASLERDRHPAGEHVADITSRFPHWFVPRFDRWANQSEAMPFDMHWLVSLIAPRPLLIGSASQDVWADPFNEFRCAKQVGEVYRLFGAEGLPADAEFPGEDEAILGDGVGYELRAGRHDVQLRDWQVLVDFMNQVDN